MQKTALRALSLVAMGLIVSIAPTSYARGRSPLLREAERQLSSMHTSVYQHRTDVDEAIGRYNYDCSGFLDYSLKRAQPDAYTELTLARSSSQRPLAQDYYTLFASPPQRLMHWIRIRKATHLHAGDIVAWLRPPDNDSHNTGHVMLIRDEPTVNPTQPKEMLVPVIDSTTSPHAQDSRHKGQTGLGSGVIGIMMNSQSEPIGYHWKGAESRREEITAIAFGRLH